MRKLKKKIVKFWVDLKRFFLGHGVTYWYRLLYVWRIENLIEFLVIFTPAPAVQYK